MARQRVDLRREQGMLLRCSVLTFSPCIIMRFIEHCSLGGGAQKMLELERILEENNRKIEEQQKRLVCDVHLLR